MNLVLQYLCDFFRIYLKEKMINICYIKNLSILENNDVSSMCNV